MDKKTSISTVILVLLVLLTLVSLSASAYLYFTNNSLTAKENSDPAECVDEDPYKGWTLYSDDKNSPSILFYYPKDWTVEDNVDIDFIKKALPQANWNFDNNSTYKYLKISQTSDPSRWVLVTKMGEINDSFNLTDYVSNLVKEDYKIGYTFFPLECDDVACPKSSFSSFSPGVKTIGCIFNRDDTGNGFYGISYFTAGDGSLYSVSYTPGGMDDEMTMLIMDSMSIN